MLVANVEDQYLVDLHDQYVGFRNQTPLAILEHLTKTWVKVENHEKVASTNTFKLLWSGYPNILLVPLIFASVVLPCIVLVFLES